MADTLTIEYLVAIDTPATLIQRQAKFITIQLADKRYRIDFIGKRAFSLKEAAQGRDFRLSFFSGRNHPMLIPYNDGGGTAYVNSAAADPEGLMAALQQEIKSMPQDWLGGRYPLFVMTVENLRTGSGLFLDYTPRSVHDPLVAICEQYGVQIKSFTYATQKQENLLLLGGSYIIASSFRVRLLT